MGALQRLGRYLTGRPPVAEPPALPPGWHIDPADPARSVHEPRSGTGTSNTTFVAAGDVGAYWAGGGAGGTGSANIAVPRQVVVDGLVVEYEDQWER